MEFTFTSEQHQFREVVQRFLKDFSPPSEVRRLMDTDAGFDAAVWQQISDELALPAISIPEAYGGAGFGLVEQGILMEEMGRALLCAPYFSSLVLGANAILNAGTEAQKQILLPGIAAGSQRATLAVTEPGGQPGFSTIETTASAVGNGYVLSGSKKFVVDGHTADLLIVVACTEGEPGLFIVDADAAGLTRTLLQSMDPTRKLASLELENVPATRLGEASGSEALARTLDMAVIALAHEMVGGAQQLFDSAVEYSKLRMQFGRVIGSFQVIKHKCANMLIQLELAKSATY